MLPFREAIKSEVTLDVYQTRLTLFLKWAYLTADELVTGAKANPTRIQDLITSYMLVQKERVRKGEISPRRDHVPSCQLPWS